MPSIALPCPLTALAAHQHGCFSRVQAHERGLTDRQLRHRIDQGLLTRGYGDTYHVAGAPRTTRAEYASASLAVPGGLVGAAAAAHLHRFDGFGPTQPIVVVGMDAPSRLDGVRILRRRDLVPRHGCRVDGIATTSIPRTVLDLAAYLPWFELGQLIDALTEGRRLSVKRLFDEFDLVARRGRNGTTAMRRVLEPRLESLTLDRSKLEELGLAFLRRFEFPDPDVEFRPPWAGPAVARVDLAYPQWRLIIELDGRKWHDRSDRFEHDRLRDQLAMAAGWVVVRITWRQLQDDPFGVAQRLRATVQTRTVGGM